MAIVVISSDGEDVRLTTDVKTLDELINREEPGWTLVEEWLFNASRSYEILPSLPNHRDEALVATQVTTRSPMGAIIYESAGIMIDHGWLRILGSGNHPRLMRSLPGWNEGRAEGFCFVADDAVGGFFALNGGALGDDSGNLYYLAPDKLDWEACNMSYSQFIEWSLGPRLNQFYETFRWTGWEDEARTLPGDKVISIYPFLWTEGPSIAERDRRVIPIEEFYDLNYRAR